MAEFRSFSIRNLLGLVTGAPVHWHDVIEDIRSNRSSASLCEKIFEIMRTSVEIMDEVDIILHPLKSELNWPLGTKDPLDFTQARTGHGLRGASPVTCLTPSSVAAGCLSWRTSHSASP